LLIKQGAKLVESTEDVLEELQGGVPQASFPDAASDAPETTDDALLRALGHDPVTLDALMARTGWPAAELSARLLDLELEGRVARLPGGLYQRRHAG
jgi:DNA processing protein